jgi:DNA-binding transcriptional LysR family regulator
VIDIAFSTVKPQSDRLECEIAFADDIVPIVAGRHSLAMKQKKKVRQFFDLPLIARESSAASRSFVDSELAKMGLHIAPALTFGNTEAIKQAVGAGLGVAFVSRIAIEHELKSKRLAIVAIRSLHLRRPLYYVRPRFGRENRLVSAIVTVVRHAARGTLPEKPRFSLR